MEPSDIPKMSEEELNEAVVAHSGDSLGRLAKTQLELRAMRTMSALVASMNKSGNRMERAAWVILIGGWPR